MINKKIKIGIIGYGRIGKTHFKLIQQNIALAEVYAICEPHLIEQQKQELINKDISSKNIFKNVDKFLATKEIEAIVICTPTNTHFEIIKKAAKAKKHIFCEKPVSSSIEEMKKIEKIIKDNHILFQVGFNRRYDHNFIALKKAIQNKESGKLYMLSITSFDSSPPPLDYVKTSGGLFKDMTIHDFDMVRFLTNQNIVEVFAQGEVLINPQIKGIDVDVATISMKLESGALVTIHNSRKAIYGYEQTALALTENGMYAIGNDTENSLISATKIGTIHQNPLNFFMDRYIGAYTKEIQEFVSLISKNSKQSLTTNFDCIQAIKICEAALKSLQTKKIVLLK